MRTFIIAIAAATIACCAAYSQTPDSHIPADAGFIAVTVDSIDTDRSYLMVTVMRDNFTPFDYKMLPTRRGSMTVEMRTPPGDMPFSVMAYEDINLNRRLDLNDQLVPVEKSAVSHCRGGETSITLTLVHYDLLIDKLQETNPAAPADTVKPENAQYPTKQSLDRK